MAQCPCCMTLIHDRAVVCHGCGAKKGCYQWNGRVISCSTAVFELIVFGLIGFIPVLIALAVFLLGEVRFVAILLGIFFASPFWLVSFILFVKVQMGPSWFR